MRAFVAALVSPGIALASCNLSGAPPSQAKMVPGGDPEMGKAILSSGSYGCVGCHTIPGIPGARGVVGPTLDGFASRVFIAGQLPNKPEVLLQFLVDPPTLVPTTGMPEVHLSLEQARHVAAYLYTLEARDAN